MELVCIFYGFGAFLGTSLGASLITYVNMKNAHNKQINELTNLNRQQQKQLDDYRESGAIQKVKVYKQTYPNATTGLKSLVCHSEWVTPEEASKINDSNYG